MGIHASRHPDVPAMRGLHLFHFMLSNCSQRVRFALEEKELEWQSHHMNLPGNEHMTEEYHLINPNGVVPTLVHDGIVIVESNDILEYLDEMFPEPPLRPSHVDERAALDERIAASSRAQASIKALSHELVFRPFRKIGEAELELFDAQASDRALLDFIRDYAEEGPAWTNRVRQAQDEMRTFLEELEAALDPHPWLSGSLFGLADISWAVNVHRLSQAHYDLSPYPRLRSWYEKIASRPGFDRAIVSYQP